MASLVARVGTPVTAAQVYGLVAGAVPGLSRAGVLVLVAQSSFETGAWRAIWNWNFGNVKKVPGHDWFSMTCTEGNPPKSVPGCLFASFSSAQAGAAYWLSTIQSRYPAAWAQAGAGNPRAFVQALKAGGYFTGPEGTYENAVASLFSTYSSTLGGGAPLAVPSAGGGILDGVNWGLVGLAAAVVSTALYVAHETHRHRAPRRLVAAENPTRRKPGRVQTLLFQRSEWTPASARAWARRHGYKASKVDLKANTIRLRQKPPGSFARLRNVSFGNGISAVVGWN